jgi:hypothetical protein
VSGGSGEGSAEKGSSSAKGGASAHGGDGAGKGQSSPGAGSGGKASIQVQEGVPVSSTEEGGGSSPLVPILIAILALAGISLGVVVWKRRHEDGAPHSSVSPEAG